MIERLMADGDKAWWQFWKKAEPEPVVEQVTVLGMDPLHALIGLVVLLALGLTIYHHPNWFFRGLAESLGWVFGLLVVGAGIGVVFCVYFASMAAGVAAFVIYLLLIGLIMGGASAL